MQRENEHIKVYLKQYAVASRKINTKFESLQRLQALATKTTTTLTPDKVQSNGAVQDKMAVCVADFIDAQSELYDEIHDLMESRRRVKGIIDQVKNPIWNDLLTKRYINDRKWEEIAVEMSFDYSWVIRLHGQALAELDRMGIVPDTR